MIAVSTYARDDLGSLIIDDISLGGYIQYMERRVDDRGIDICKV